MAKVKTCPCCGQLIPPTLMFQGRVSQRLYDFVAKHPEGVDREQIADFVYAEDPNGGPDSEGAVKALIWRMNVNLKSKNLRIKSSMGRGSVYRLVQL